MKDYKLLFLSDSGYLPCYDEETEVLTNNGWKYFRDCTIKDKFYTLNPQTKEIFLNKPEKIVKQYHKGKMYLAETTQINVCVTPNHKMFVGKKNKKRKIIYRLEEANTTYGKTCNYYLKNGKWNRGYTPKEIIIAAAPRKNRKNSYTPIQLDESYSVKSSDYVEAMAYILADGYYLNENYFRKDTNQNIYEVGIRQKGKERIKKLGDALQKITLNKVYYSNRGVLVRDKRLWSHVKQFGQCLEKHIPPIIKQMTPEMLKLFWYSYAYCDGLKKNPNVILTSSKRMRDDLQEIALKMGYSANYIIRKKYTNKIGNRTISSDNPNYRLSLMTKRNSPLLNENKKQDKWIDFDGNVWCAVVPPHHIIYVRRKGKPIWCGNTGYARISRELTKRLAQEPEFEVQYIGAQYAGMPMYSNFETTPILTQFNAQRDWPLVLENGREAYGKDILPFWLSRVRPDLLFVLLDIFMVQYMRDIEVKPSKFLMYFPSDGTPLPLYSEYILRKAHTAVAMAKFGQKQAIDLGIDAKYIPHATNPSQFYSVPKELKMKYREEWSQKLNYPLQDKFIVGYVGRNQGRKMVDRLIVAFAKFAKNNPKAILMMHCDPWDNAAVVNLVEMTRQYGIYEKVIYTGATLHTPYTDQELLQIYNLFDISASATSGEGFGLCLKPNVEIVTKNGMKKIKDISFGEEVLSHTGNFRKVMRTMKRKVSEKIYKIKVYGLNKEIEITAEHPVYAIKKPKKKYMRRAKYEEMTPSWVKAKDLEKGDCILFAIPKGNDEEITFDLSTFSSFKEKDESFIWNKNGFSGNRKYSYTYLSNYLNESKKVIENARKCLKNNSVPRTARQKFVVDSLNQLGDFEEANVKRYNRKITLDAQLAYVLGWYIAEGSGDKNSIEIDMHSKELDYAMDINEIIKAKFGNGGKITTNGNSLRLSISGEPIAKFFTEMCGKGAHNKRINKKILYGRTDILEKVIEGLFLGDGHSEPEGKVLTTVSKLLADEVKIALMRLGKKPSSCFTKKGTYSVGYRTNNHNGAHSNKSWFTEKDFRFSIRDIKLEEYSGSVYNLEVEVDNSYTTLAGTVHNCTIEGMACEIPVVITDCTSTQEIVTDNAAGIPVPLKGVITGTWNVDRSVIDVDKMAEAFQYLHDNPSERARMGKNGRQAVLRDYDWKNVYKDWKNLITEVLEK